MRTHKFPYHLSGRNDTVIASQILVGGKTVLVAPSQQKESGFIRQDAFADSAINSGVVRGKITDEGKKKEVFQDFYMKDIVLKIKRLSFAINKLCDWKQIKL